MGHAPFRASALGIAVAVAASTAYSQEHVENGGFETGSFSPWWAPPSIPNQSTFWVQDYGAYSGEHCALLSSTSLQYIGQILSTTAGQDYELSFWLMRPLNAVSLFVVRWEGQPVFSEDFSLPSANQWYQFNVPVHSNITGSFLEFGQNDFPAVWLLDDVSVRPVPAPGAAALFGIGGLFAFRRNRRRDAV